MRGLRRPSFNTSYVLVHTHQSSLAYSKIHIIEFLQVLRCLNRIPPLIKQIKKSCRRTREREGKNRKRGKNGADDEKRELTFKEDGQEYAQVLRMLGNGRCEAMCIDGKKRLCHIRGNMHKKIWIAVGDIILVGLRDYQDDKADVIWRYSPDGARLLKLFGELPENTRINWGISGDLDEEDDGPGDDYIDFDWYRV